MKLYQILLTLYLLSYTIAIDCDKIVNPTSKKDCNEKLSDADTQAGYKYCCYSEVSVLKSCIALSQESYDSIGKTKTGNYGEGKIECNSYFTKLGLLSFIFVFL